MADKKKKTISSSHGKHGREGTHKGTWLEKRKERDNWEDLGIDWRMMLKYNLKNRLVGRGL